MADVLGVLEPAKHRMVVTKVVWVVGRGGDVIPQVQEAWEAEFTKEAESTRREIDALAPKSG